jgi:NADH-quinone oxidoreductase subunit M
LVIRFSVIAVVVPLLGAGVIALTACLARFGRITRDGGPARKETYRRIASTSAALTFGVVLFSAVVDLVLGPRGPEGLGSLFAFLAAATWLPVVFVAKQCDQKRPELLYGILLLLEAAFLGLFFTDDVLLFCLSLESSTLLLSLLIIGWSGREGEPIGRKFLLYNLTADMLVMIPLLGLVVSAGRMSSESIYAAPHELSYSITTLTQDVPRLETDEIGGQEYWRHARRWLLTMLILGLVMKTPCVPFHTWFATAVAETPLCAGLVMLGAAMRVSGYALVRIVSPLCGDLGVWGDLLVAMVVMGAFYEGFLTLAHGDLRKLTACAALSQVSLAVAGFFSQQIWGTTASVLLTISGGLAATLLLFLFGFLEMRFDARDLSHLTGIGRRLPQVACGIVIASISLVGIPGLGGFPGLYTALVALFAFGWLSLLLGMIAALIVAWALLWTLERLVFSPPSSGTRITPSEEIEIISSQTGAPSGDFHTMEFLLIAPLIAGIVFIGLRPQLVVDLIDASLRMGLYTS